MSCKRYAAGVETVIMTGAANTATGTAVSATAGAKSLRREQEHNDERCVSWLADRICGGELIWHLHHVLAALSGG